MTALQVYVVFVVLLTLNLLGLWVFSGAARGKTKTTLNEEDARTVLRGSKVTDAEPAEVQRVLRAHANAMANIIPFLFLAQLWVLVAAPKPVVVLGVCSAFTVARFGHSFAYLNGAQPWRSMFWGMGLLVTLGVLVLLVINTFA